jgi:NADH-ubiquinone oxidoreductase chain 5
LPIAIAAPTPISSLVHSSTLVTAGIFVLLRYNFFLKNLINQNFFLNLCLITILFRRLKAINENDMKKIIALSTLSQISLIMFLVMLNIKFISFIYLCNHALFKSLIFINIGIIMLKNFSNQLEININTFNRIKLYFISFKLSCLNLINIPFFSSFFLKEKIIYMFYNSQISYLKFVIFIFNSFLTINYSLKFLFFFDKKLRNINYNIKFYYIINIIIFVTFFSIIFSKLMFQTIVLKRKSTIILYIYIISIIINFKIYKVKMKLINNLIFLNILFFSQIIFIFIKINKLKEIEL